MANRAFPGVVSTPDGPLRKIAQIAAGGAHTCALLTNAKVRCWGHNHHGQIGDGSTEDRVHPTPVSNANGTGQLSGVVQVAAGGRFPTACCELKGGVHHTCALLSNGRVQCWGTNSTGQLGDGTTTNSALPVAVKE